MTTTAPPYTPEDDDLIKSLWLASPPPRIEDIALHFPERSVQSVYKRIRRLQKKGILTRRKKPEAQTRWSNTLSGELPRYIRDTAWVDGKRREADAQILLDIMVKQNFRCALTGAAFTERLPPRLLKLPQPVYVLPPVAKMFRANPTAVSLRLLRAIMETQPSVLLD